MVVFLIVVAVLIGIAYADYCLIDNTEHFGISFTKADEAERERAARERLERIRAEAERRAEEEKERAARETGTDESELEESEEPAAALVARVGDRRRRRAGPIADPAPAWLLQELEPVPELDRKAS